jgi:hypothetical protein
MGLR